MMQNLRVSLLQWDLAWENPEQNLLMANKLLGKMIPTDVVVLPEMFTTGFTMNAKSVAEEMTGTAINWMQNQARIHNVVLTGSLIIKEKNSFFNRAVIAYPDGNLDYYDKRHLFSYAGEDRVFSPGNNLLTIKYKEWKIKILICYDLRFPVWSRNTDDTDVLIYVANWPKVRAYAWNQLLRSRAIENLCYVAAVNRIGTDSNEIPYQGDTQMIDFSGKVMASLEDKEGIINVTLDRSELTAFRKRFPFLNDRDKFSIEI
ncbi:MAG: amidohydrolase [Saprospirales bacterium]|nr:MAG: amidohydrolase [Saprospirales bacterium]